MKDSPMTWADTSNFTKKVYSENEPLPPQVYERLKCYCDGENKLPPEITKIIGEGFLSIGKITYICNRLKTIAEVTPAVINLASTIQDALPKIPQ